MPIILAAQVEAMQRDLFDVVDRLAKLEQWNSDSYDLVVGTIKRQPITTPRPDLAYFTERLSAARGATGR
ncbi:hypothetical protein [Burkholderia perseverans]|uniref:hypothetical protein n=1 Tax=Burkholderia perseverans TaxID=2615214 RepID=UPI001FF060EC|nr:hypothetical protein [Burkholderia perseverans]